MAITKIIETKEDNDFKFPFSTHILIIMKETNDMQGFLLAANDTDTNKTYNLKVANDN